MKRCIEAHTVAAFGEIPEGSLWDDDSPYITDESKFADVATSIDPPEFDAPTDPPVKRPAKKSVAKLKES